MPNYQEVNVSSVAEYIQFIDDYCDPECNKYYDDDYVLFRGQRSDNPLLPKIARLILQDKYVVAEENMLADFKRMAIRYLSIQPKTKWDWIALAQHHGMATRLLDWTLNPLAALWFATHHIPEKNKDGSNKYGIVWMLYGSKNDIVKPVRSNDPFKITRTRLFQPRHIASRIVAQSGWFTVHKYIESKDEFIPLERNKNFSLRLIKVYVEPSEFWSIRAQLDRLDINSASLFPDIDGLCSHVEWQHSCIADEVES